MYIGHSLLAFTLAGLAAWGNGARDRTVLLAGAAAAGFALIPDVDSAYTIWAVLRAGPSNVFPTTEYVWTAEGWFVHRSLTHSLLIGVVTAVLSLVAALGIRRPRQRHRAGTIAIVAGLGGGLVVIGFLTDGVLGVATMGLYLGAAIVVTLLAVRAGVPARLIGWAAAIGILTHPFGDVFMGRPPAFFYPILTRPSVEKVAVATDPTVNLVGLFIIEIFLAWSVLWLVTRVTEEPLRDHIAWRATIGIVFATAVMFIRPPTLAVAYHFTLGTLATGAVLGVAPTLVDRTPSSNGFLTPVTTGLATVTLAVAGYLLAYLVYAA